MQKPTYLEFNGPLHPSFYHFVCDANVRSDKGGTSGKTLEWIKSLHIEDQKFQSLCMSLNNMDSVIKEFATSCKFNYIYSNRRFENASREGFPMSEIFLDGKKDENIPFGDSLLAFRRNIINCFVTRMQSQKSHLIDPAFFEGGTQKHAIAFYLEGDSLIICNSGEGLSYTKFHEKKDNKYEVIAKFKIIPSKRWHVWATILLCSDFDLDMDNTFDLYELLSIYLIKQPANSLYFYESQISGSCTFWSTFYMLLYLTKETKHNLEIKLLEHAGQYFMGNKHIMQKKYGYDGLVACVEAKFIFHKLALPDDFNTNTEYTDHFYSKNGFKTNPLGNQPIKAYELTNELKNHNHFYKATSALDLLKKYPTDELVSYLHFYYNCLQLLDIEFANIKNQDNRFKISEWMEVFFHIKEIYQKENLLANNWSHLRQLIMCFILVSDHMSTFRLWKPDEKIDNKVWQKTKELYFACGIIDARIQKHIAILSLYSNMFWTAQDNVITSCNYTKDNLEKIFTNVIDENHKTKIIDKDDYLRFFDGSLKYEKRHVTFVNEDIPIYAYAWIFPFVALRDVTAFHGHNISTLNGLVTHILTHMGLVNGQLIWQNDGEKFYISHRSSEEDKYVVSLRFFDFNNLLIDRIISGNYSEKEIMRNLPIFRLLYPVLDPMNPNPNLYWPLDLNQFKGYEEKEFNHTRASQLLTQNINSFSNTSTKILAYVATLFFLTSKQVPRPLQAIIAKRKDKIKDIFFIQYIEIISKNASPDYMDVFNMISSENFNSFNFTESQGNDGFFELLFANIIISLIPRDVSQEFFISLSLISRQTKTINRIQQTFPESKIEVQNRILKLDGKDIYMIDTKEGDLLFKLSFCCQNKLIFYSSEYFKKSGFDYSCLKFFNQQKLNGKKYHFEFLSNQLHLIWDKKDFVRREDLAEGKPGFWKAGPGDEIRFNRDEDELLFYPGEHFVIRIVNEKKILLTTNHEYLIIEEHHRFASFAGHSCVIYDEKSKTYSLFIRHLDKISTSTYESPWTSVKPKELNFSLENDTHIIISIASNSSHLIFQDAEQAYCYLKFCIYYQDVDNLYIHFTQLMYLIQTASPIIQDKFKEYLNFFQNSFNNPFSAYFYHLYESVVLQKNDQLFSIDDYNYTETHLKNNWPEAKNPPPRKGPITYFNIPKTNSFKFDVRQSKFPLPFQLLKQKPREFETQSFSLQLKELFYKYAELLQENVYSLKPRKSDQKDDDVYIKSWLQTLDGKEVCETANIKQQVYVNLMKTKQLIRIHTEDLEKQLTLLVVQHMKTELISDILFANHNLLAVAMVNRILLNSLETLDEESITKCQSVSKYVNYLDIKHVYTEERSNSYLYLEYMLGYFIRKDQHQFINKLLNSNHKSYIALEELLMGLGKTSVILPLLSCEIQSISRQFIVVPQHMQRESGLNLAMYVENRIFPLTNSTRENPFLNINQLLNERQTTWLIDDLELKRIQLNKLVWAHRIDSLITTQLSSILESSKLIIDEFDSVYNPSTSVLQYPIGDITIGSTGITIQEWEILLTEIFTNNKLITFPKITKALLMSEKMIQNQHYGFSHIDTSRTTAVPYVYVNKPVEGSSFSDIILHFILTFRLHANLKTIMPFHSTNVLSFIHKHIFSKFIKEGDIIYTILSRLQLQDDFSQTELNYIQYISEDEQLDFISTKLQSSKSKKSFFHQFVNEIVLPSMGESDWIVSTSFLEAIYRHPYQKIYAFSGTTNMILPNGDRPPENMINKGAIHHAILSSTNSLKWNTNLTILQNLMNCKNMDAFIDAGAFLIGEDMQELALKLAPSISKDVLFFASNGDKLVASKNSKTISFYRSEKLPLNTMILYDQAHCIGVNIVQFLPMNGFVTVDLNSSQYEFVAQGIFRLRSINHGHSIQLLTKNNTYSTIDILQNLHKNSDFYVKNTQEVFRLLQTITCKAQLPLLRPKFSEIRFKGNYSNYLQRSKAITQLNEFQKYLQLKHEDSFTNIQHDVLKEKSKEQQMSNNDNISSICDFTEIWKKWGIFQDHDFDEWSFAVVQYPFQRFVWFKTPIQRKKNTFQNTKLSAPIPYYYNEAKQDRKITLTTWKNGTKHTDESDTNVVLRWLSGAHLSYHQQLKLDFLFLNDPIYTLTDIKEVIKCLNGARIATFGDINRIIKLFNYSNWKTYYNDISTDSQIAQEFGFFNQKQIHSFRM